MNCACNVYHISSTLQQQKRGSAGQLEVLGEKKRAWCSSALVWQQLHLPQTKSSLNSVIYLRKKSSIVKTETKIRPHIAVMANRSQKSTISSQLYNVQAVLNRNGRIKLNDGREEILLVEVSISLSLSRKHTLSLKPRDLNIYKHLIHRKHCNKVIVGSWGESHRLCVIGWGVDLLDQLRDW